MKLRGPADPDRFRKQDQWKRRVYFDNLPTCNVAPAWDGEVFGVTTFKGAWDKEFRKKLRTGELVKLDALRAARFVIEHPDVLKMRASQAEATIAASADHDLDDASKRGQDVHKIMESIAAGAPLPLDLRQDALAYEAACRQFITDHRPEFLYSEVVGINRGLGYGGTADTYALVDGRLISIDYKSRGDDSQHGAYDNEAAQVGGAYTHFDYLIIEEDGQPKRIPMPDLAGAWVVSLKTDSYEVYPIDMEAAWAAFQDMHAGYLLKLRGQAAGRRAIGTPIRAPRRSEPEVLVGLNPAPLRERCQWIKEHSELGYKVLRNNWPEGLDLRAAAITEAEFASMAVLLAWIERDFDVPFGPQPEVKVEPRWTLTDQPDEGRQVEEATVKSLQAKARKLSQSARHWLKVTADEAEAAGAGVRVWDEPTLRRFELARGLITLAKHDLGDRLPELVALTIGDQPGDPVALLASFSVDDATRFALHVDALVLGLAGADTQPITAA